MKFSISTLSCLVVATLISSSLYAKPVESVKDYSLRIKEATVQFERLAREARGNKDVVMNDRAFAGAMNTFGFSKVDSARVAQAVVDGKLHVVTAIYASLAAREMLSNRQTDVADLDVGISSIVRASAVSGKGVATRQDLKLDSNEMVDAAEALQRKTEYSVDMLSWSKEDAEIHINVMKRTAELLDQGNITAEEALVMAIMEKTGEGKSGAMKIIRKLKKCV